MWTVVSMVLLLRFLLGAICRRPATTYDASALGILPDSSRFWYKLGGELVADRYSLRTRNQSATATTRSQEASNTPQISSNPCVFGARTSPNGNWNAYLDAEHPLRRATSILRASRSAGQSEATASVPDADSGIPVGKQFSSVMGDRG